MCGFSFLHFRFCQKAVILSDLGSYWDTLFPISYGGVFRFILPRSDESVSKEGTRQAFIKENRLKSAVSLILLYDRYSAAISVFRRLISTGG
jgi:hypothetical protein